MTTGDGAGPENSVNCGSPKRRLGVENYNSKLLFPFTKIQSLFNKLSLLSNSLWLAGLGAPAKRRFKFQFFSEFSKLDAIRMLETNLSASCF